MSGRREVLSVYKKLISNLRERFEKKYGYTPKKRATYEILEKLPNGFEILHMKMNIEGFEGKTCSVIKFDPNNIDVRLKYHGEVAISSETELNSKIEEVFGVPAKFKADPLLIADALEVSSQIIIYYARKYPTFHPSSLMLDMYVSDCLDKAIETRLIGLEDDVYALNADVDKRTFTRVFKISEGVPAVVFDLPYALELKDGKYRFDLDGISGEIRFIGLRRSYQDGRPPLFGVYTAVPFTRAVVVWDSRETDDEGMIIGALRLLNRILELYRFVTGRFHLPDVHANDIQEYRTYHPDRGSSMSAKIQWERPDFMYEDREVDESVNRRLRAYFARRKCMRFHEGLLMNSKRHVYESNYHYALLEAVISLEIIFSEFLRKSYLQQCISKKRTEDFLLRVGLSDKMAMSLPALLGPRVKKKAVQECMGAIKLRNRIVHEGYRDISKGSVIKQIAAIDDLIAVLDREIRRLDRAERAAIGRRKKMA